MRYCLKCDKEVTDKYVPNCPDCGGTIVWKPSEKDMKRMNIIMPTIFIIGAISFIIIIALIIGEIKPTSSPKSPEEQRYEEQYQNEKRKEIEGIYDAIDDYKYNEYKNKK